MRVRADLLASPGWETHVPVSQFGVYASMFPGARASLWTFVNRNEFDIAGEQLVIQSQAGMHYYDLRHGTELSPRTLGANTLLDFMVDALGYGAVLSAVRAVDTVARFTFIHERTIDETAR